MHGGLLSQCARRRHDDPQGACAVPGTVYPASWRRGRARNTRRCDVTARVEGWSRGRWRDERGDASLSLFSSLSSPHAFPFWRTRTGTRTTHACSAAANRTTAADEAR